MQHPWRASRHGRRVDEDGALARPEAEKRSNLRLGTDALIAELARRGEGRLRRADLVAAGVSDDQIAFRVRSGALVRLRRGVYRLAGVPESARARLRAALLHVGTDAIGSHLTAGGEWGFTGSPLVVDVTTPRKLRRRDGIRIHRRLIDPQEIRTPHGLPFTSPSQTLFDLTTMLGLDSLLKAANEAFVLQLVSFHQLRATRARNARRKGSASFEKLLRRLDPSGHRVRSPLEVRLHSFLRSRGFPPWESNVTLDVGDEKIRPDVLWREQRVVIEADGRDPHLAPLTFVSDRRRDRRLRVHGWESVRVTSPDLAEGADELEADLRTLLRAQASGESSSSRRRWSTES